MNEGKKFPDALKRRRLELGWSQEEVAHRADISQTAVSRAERLGHKGVSLRVIGKVTKALGL